MGKGKTRAIDLVKKLLTAQLADRQPHTAADCLTADVSWFGLGNNGDVRNREEAYAWFIQEATANPRGYLLQFTSENADQIAEDCYVVNLKMTASRDEASIRCIVMAVTKCEDGAQKIASVSFSVADAGSNVSLEQYYRQAEQLRLYRVSQNAGTYRILMDEKWSLLYGNDRFYNMLEYSPQDFQEKLGGGCMGYVHPEDREMVAKAIEEAIGCDNKYAEWTMRVITGKNNLRYLHVVGIFEKTADGYVMEGMDVDVTEQKMIEQELLERNAMFEVLLDNSNLSIWSYDIFTHTATLMSSKKHARPMSYTGTVNYPESVIKVGFIQESSMDTLRNLIKSVDEGIRSASAEIWYSPKEGEPWCDKVTYISVFDKDGKIVRTIGIAEDITDQKLAQQQYEEELNYQQTLHSDNLLTKVRANLTQNRLESYESAGHVTVGYDNMPYDESVDALSRAGYTQDDRTMIVEKLKSSAIIQAFEHGQQFFSFDYRRMTKEKKVIWVNISVKTYRDMRSGDIKSFMYTININDEKINEEITQSVVNSDYDFIMLIDIRNNSFSMFRSNDELVLMPPDHGDDYVGMMQTVNRTAVDSDEAERAVHDMMPETIEENLKKASVFSGVYRAIENNGSISHKKITYKWLNEEMGQVVLTRTDVSKVVLEQQRQQDLLRDALRQAEQANNAKTDFLSKMSHEIRTPMNAIIGMNALAAQCLNDPQQAADCIAKVGISARFLLSLINDILDMSRIESGKMNLRNENIPFEEFINGINGIIYEQAVEHGLSYDSILTGLVADNYMGDAMKLQQILINLLGNAVKFTPKGGKVQLIVTQERVEHEKAWMKFTVNDTGVGISEEFQKVMFEPFEQEQTGITTPYSGTGLGLAITKNLVHLMGGSISVNSIVGVGSEFVVTVPLGISEGTTPHRVSKDIHLDTMSALVVDDEILICQQTQSLLAEVGMKAEWVDSGHKAVKLVRTRWEAKKYFDIILIDWKMPEMDGIETARQIRKIVGPDVTIIIITAYEWAEIEREARAAGVNLLVSKPIFRSSLISTFERIYADKQRTQPVVREPLEYDFTGKRVLLTEDHLLNVEVAKRILQAKGIEVEVAENGLAAIEAFASHPDGYFDLILMDIRMPVMDGLTAAKSIRQLKKATSKTIPIIAMSANAFDDDIEKSHMAGMNAHLSKPIEPRLLYETLARFLQISE